MAICLFGALVVGALGEDALDTLTFQFEVRLESLGNEKTDLDANYERQLDGLEAKLKAKGDLAGVITVRAEKSSFRDPEDGADKPTGEIGRFRALYERGLKDVRSATHRKKIDLYQKYVSAMKPVLTALTKEGKVERAKEASALLAQTEKTLAELKETDPNWVAIEVEGQFFVDVDDSASIYVNGTKVHGAGINFSTSKPITLRERDFVVVSLRNVFAGVRFKIAFATPERDKVVSFRAEDFRVFEDAGKQRNVTKERFAELQLPAHRQNGKGKDFGFPNRSEPMWGPTKKHSVIVCQVTREMITVKEAR